MINGLFSRFWKVHLYCCGIGGMLLPEFLFFPTEKSGSKSDVLSI